MSGEQWTVLVVAAGAVVAFVSEKVRSDVVALCVLCALALTGVIDSSQALAGFANEAVATVAAMFILSAALEHSGALLHLTRLLGWAARSRMAFRAALMPAAGLLSAFVNNTAVVAVMLPSVLRIAREKGWGASGFLIPLSYASQFGGVCTLIGTSTNLLVHSLAVKAGRPGFTLFEFTGLGLVMLVVGTVYLLAVSHWLLPDHGGAKASDLFVLDDFVTELEVEGDGLVGRSVDELDLPGQYGLVPLDLIRGERRYWRPSAVRLERGDVIRVSGAVKDFTALAANSGLKLHAERFFGAHLVRDQERRLIEVLIPPQSFFVGRTVRELRLPQRWNAALLAVRRHARPLSRRLSRVRLEAGDVALLMTTREGAVDLSEERDLVVLSEKEHVPPRVRSLVWPVAVCAAVVVVAALGWLPIYLAALIGCALLLLSRALTSEEAIAAVDWRVLLLIAGMLPLGLAMQSTGLADDFVRHAFAWLGTDSPQLALAMVYLMTAVLTEVMSNNAAAVLLVPVGLSVAEHFGVDAKPFLVAIAFAASTSFATPVGYQTNTMVYNAGRYRFMDFVRIGVPLNLIFWLGASALIPVFFPFAHV